MQKGHYLHDNNLRGREKTPQDGTMWRHKGPEFSRINNIRLQNEGAHEVMNGDFFKEKNLFHLHLQLYFSLNQRPTTPVVHKMSQKAWEHRWEKACLQDHFSLTSKRNSAFASIRNVGKITVALATFVSLFLTKKA